MRCPERHYCKSYLILDLRFKIENSCLWNLCYFGLVYSIDWVRQPPAAFGYFLEFNIYVIYAITLTLALTLRDSPYQISTIVAIRLHLPFISMFSSLGQAQKTVFFKKVPASNY